jgi:hypothetical protein
MRKLKLELDGLAVESFDTLPGRDTRRGTVEAFITGPNTTCFEYNETYAPTCAATCASCAGDTCAFTCGATCNYTCDDPSCVTCLTYCGQASCVEICP